MNESVPPPPEFVSVIIPARNAATTIGLQLEALSQQTYSGQWEIIVVNNDSQDETETVVRAWQQRLPHLRIVSAPNVRGANHARNVGCRVSEGKLLLFTDADDVVDTNWVTEMVQGLRDYEALGGHLDHSANDPVSLAAQAAFKQLKQGFGFLSFAPGPSCGFHRNVWLRLGGFDESYRGGAEEIDFFWRAQLSGYELGRAPRAIVHRRLRSSIRAMVRQYYGYGKAHPQLYRNFSAYGMPPSQPDIAFKEWWWLITHLFDFFRSQNTRAIWSARLAVRWGRIVGSIRNRVLYL